MIASLSRPLVFQALSIALAGAICVAAPLLAPPLLAGPNEGGTLVVHDTGLSYTEEVSSYPSPPPTTDPPTVDNALPVGPPADAAGWVWKVYAAFPTNSSPRLKALVMAEQFGAGVRVLAGGLPSALDFEIPQNGWPTTSGGAVGISFGTVKTSLMVECYWFGGYGSAGEIWALAAHPTQAMIFVDDSSPPLEDAIAGLSSIGFGVNGNTVYPQPLPDPVACCFAEDGHCELLRPDVCVAQGGASYGGPCDPNPCPQPPFGACCFPDGHCEFVQENQCAGVWYGGGSVCDPNPCPQPPFGACCFSDGHCEYLQQMNCGGIWFGSGSVCDPNPCPQPLGACCYASGACQFQTEAPCLANGGTWYGPGTDCTPNPCPQPPPVGACCYTGGACTMETEEDCSAHGGTWYGTSLDCDPNPCPAGPPVNAHGVLVVHDTGLGYTDDSASYPSDPPASCEAADNIAPPDSSTVWKVYAAFPEQNQPRLKALVFGEEFNPALVTILGAGLPSALDFEIPQNGWPNTPGGGVGIAFGETQTAHIVEVYWFGGYGSPGAAWLTAPHPTQPMMFADDSSPPLEEPIEGLGSIGFGVSGESPCDFPPPGALACCFSDGTCVVVYPDACVAAGGMVTPEESCEPNPCPPPAPEGACCFSNGSCMVLTQGNCEAQGGIWQGAGIDCSPNPCPQPPPTGACCFTGGTCVMMTPADCSASGGSWYGGDCWPNPCPGGPCGGPAPDAYVPGPEEVEGRVGGDTIGTATNIPALPYYDTGNTCGFVNDYDEVCPYSGSTSPDCVYRYVPPSDVSVGIDLCASLYDTKVYVWEDTPYNEIACNDDFGCGYSGWQSRLENVLLCAGHTYYIVVDGYGGSCGDYILTIDAYAGCVVECPAGAQLEGEPPCINNYYDQYNGGCNTTGWTAVEAQSGDCADVCGRSCTYSYQGLSYRDTDWYTMTAMGGLVEASCVAEFPLQFILIYGADCNNLQYTLGSAGPCEPVNLSWSFASGTEFWLWAGPSTFSGIPESDYTFSVCGIEGNPPVPTVEMSWGQVKAVFRRPEAGRHAALQRPKAPAPAGTGPGASPEASPATPWEGVRGRLGVMAPPKPPHGAAPGPPGPPQGHRKGS